MRVVAAGRHVVEALGVEEAAAAVAAGRARVAAGVGDSVDVDAGADEAPSAATDSTWAACGCVDVGAVAVAARPMGAGRSSQKGQRARHADGVWRLEVGDYVASRVSKRSSREKGTRTTGAKVGTAAAQAGRKTTG